MYVNFNLLGSTLVGQAKTLATGRKEICLLLQLFRSDLHFITASNSLASLCLSIRLTIRTTVFCRIRRVDVRAACTAW